MSSLQQWITNNIHESYSQLAIDYSPLVLIIAGVLFILVLYLFNRLMVYRKYKKLAESFRKTDGKFKSEFWTAYDAFGINIIKCAVDLIDAEKDLDLMLKGRIKELLQTPGVKFARIKNRIRELLKKEDTPIIKFINEASDLLSEAEKLLSTSGPFLILSVENIEHAERLKRQMEELPTEYKLALSSTDIEDTKSEPQPKNNDG